MEGPLSSLLILSKSFNKHRRHRQISFLVFQFLIKVFSLQMSVPITTTVVSSNPARDDVLDATLYDICYSLSVTCGRSVDFPGYSGFVHHDIQMYLKYC